MSFKLLSISSMYRGYLDSFYRKYTSTKELSYHEHYNLLLNDTTEFAGSYTLNFRKLGIDAQCIIANDIVLQNKWKKEACIDSEDNSKILFEQVNSFRPDILWIEDLNHINSEWFGKIREKVKSISCIIAYHCAPYNKNQIDKLKLADIIITCTPGLKLDFEAMGLKTYLVYHGFDTNLLSRLNEKAPAAGNNLIFSGSLISGGNFHNSRIKLIESLLNNNLDIALYVTLENKYKIKAKQAIYLLSDFLRKVKLEKVTDKYSIFEYGKTPVLGYSNGLMAANHNPVYGLDMYNLFRSAKIVLNIHIGVAGIYAGNMRLFEVTGVGSCLLTDNKRNLSDLFEIGKEVVAYESPEDCISKARWLLDHEDERSQIARAGQKKTLESHTVNSRCKSIIEIINNH